MKRKPDTRRIWRVEMVARVAGLTETRFINVMADTETEARESSARFYRKSFETIEGVTDTGLTVDDALRKGWSIA